MLGMLRYAAAGSPELVRPRCSVWLHDKTSSMLMEVGMDHVGTLGGLMCSFCY